MSDNLSQKQRSKCMSHIKSKWTTQEIKIHNYLKGRKIKHKMYPLLQGNPDILLINSNIVVFLNGCFWHKCSKCYVEPKSKRDYWLPNIENNQQRDIKNQKILKESGFNVLIIWEHQIKKEFDNVVNLLVN